MKSVVLSDGQPNGLQSKLDRFLADHPNIEIVEMTQSESPNGSFVWFSRSVTILTILYKDV